MIILDTNVLSALMQSQAVGDFISGNERILTSGKRLMT